MSSTNSFLLSSEALGLVLFLLILGIRSLELQLSHIEILFVFNAALILLFKKAPPPREIILFDDFRHFTVVFSSISRKKISPFFKNF